VPKGMTVQTSVVEIFIQRAAAIWVATSADGVSVARLERASGDHGGGIGRLILWRPQLRRGLNEWISDQSQLSGMVPVNVIYLGKTREEEERRATGRKR